MTMTSRDELIDRLRLSVEVAKARLQNANAIFSDVVKDIPSGIPVPDGAMRIRNAGQEKAAAQAELQSALDRLNAVVFNLDPPAESNRQKFSSREI